MSPKPYSNLPDGKYTFAVRAIDQVGNVALATASRSFRIDTAVKAVASANKKQEQRGNKIVVKVKVQAKEDLRAQATGKVKVKKKSYKLKPQRKGVSDGKKKTLKLKPKKKDAKKIAKALKKGKTAKTQLTLKLTGATGNKETQKLAVKLKR